MTVVVVDTTVLSNFAHVERADFVKLAFPEIIAPRTVVSELRQGESLGLVPSCDWSWLPVVDRDPAEHSPLDRLGKMLGRGTIARLAQETLKMILDPGEVACIVLAISIKAVVATDDASARRVARSLGLAVSGTLGALANLVDGGYLTLALADQLLQTMIVKGYRSPVRSLAGVMEDAELAP